MESTINEGIIYITFHPNKADTIDIEIGSVSIDNVKPKHLLAELVSAKANTPPTESRKHQTAISGTSVLVVSKTVQMIYNHKGNSIAIDECHFYTLICMINDIITELEEK